MDPKAALSLQHNKFRSLGTGDELGTSIPVAPVEGVHPDSGDKLIPERAVLI